jgi:hypothetical protein
MAPFEAPSSARGARRPHSDTSPEVEALMIERLRRMTPSQRVEQGARLCKLARQVMRAGIRMRHSEYGEEQVEMALARLLWGDELYRAARPQWPLLEP